MVVEKTSDSRKWEADLLWLVGNDVSLCTTILYIHFAFPMLLFYPSAGGLLSEGLVKATVN